MTKFIRWLAKSSIFLYSISLCAIVFALKALIYAFKHILKIQDIQFREEFVNEKFEVTVNLAINTLLFAPIIETLVFQALFFYIFKRLRVEKWIIALISGAAFGAFHNYSVFYMISAALPGFIFMYMYALRAELDNRPFVSTVAAHFTVNLTVTIAIIVTHFIKYRTLF